MDGFGNSLMLPRTQISGGDNVHAAAHADQEASEQRNQNGGGAHRPQRLRARKSSDHGDVGHVEQNLQYIGKHEGDAETDNGRKQRTLRQGIGLGFTHA